MTESGRALFETAIGWCGLAWGPDGLVGTMLPDRDRTASVTRLAHRYPDRPDAEPPAEVQAAIAAIQALLAGEPRDLAEIRLDLARVGEPERAIYAIARAIPPGQTRTYGDIARQLGDVALSRAVGQAMGRNPWPIVVPCHRVLGADGKAGGFSAPGGLQTKARMLTIERAQVGAGAGGLFDDLPIAIKPRK
jgi:methylated-DNA-[protein]-cysteine S-methyltransferase